MFLRNTILSTSFLRPLYYPDSFVIHLDSKMFYFRLIMSKNFPKSLLASSDIFRSRETKVGRIDFVKTLENLKSPILRQTIVATFADRSIYTFR